MAVLKTQCPECDAKIRLTVEGAGGQKTECPKCGHAFVARPDPGATTAATAAKKTAADPPKKTAKGLKDTAKAGSAAKKTKVVARQDDDDDDDDTPKKKKKGGADGKKQQMLIAGVAVGLLAVVGVGAAFLLGSSKDKTAQTSDAPPAAPLNAIQPPPGPGPVVPPVTNPKPKDKIDPKPKDKVEAKPKDKEIDADLATALPPKPKIKLSGSLVPTGKPVVKPPAVPPLAPDQDPFVRAKNFVPDGPLPELPKLPDRGLRPVLALDSGGHTAFISKVFFTPDGKRIITVAEDKAVRIWDPATNEAVKTLRFPAGPGKEGSLLAAALARNGKRLAVAGEPVKGVAPGKVPIYIVSPETGATIKRIDASSDTINCMHFSNDGNRIAVGCADTVVQVFDVNTGALLGAIPGVGGLEIKFNPMPKTNFIASLGPRGRVLLLDLVTRQNLEFRVTTGVPITLAWSNDGKFLAVGCTNGTIVLFTSDGKPVKALPALVVNKDPVKIYQLQFLPEDRDLVVVGSHRFAGVVDSNTGKVGVSFDGHNNSVFAVDASADGRRIASCGGNQHDTMVWGADDGKVQHRMAGAGAGVWALGWSKDGKSLAWGNQNRREGDDTELPLEHTFRLDEFGLGGKPDPTKYTQVVTSDEGVGLILGYQKFLVSTPGREPQVVPLGSTIYSATLLPKGNAVVVGGVSDIVLVNPATLKRSSNPFVGHTGNVLCVTPSPDGRYFASGSNDQTIRIWRRDLEEPLLSIFVAGREWIAWTPQGYYACSPQGERLISWQISGGTGVGAAAKPPQVHPAERFRKSLYQPALLKYVVPAGDLPRAMAMAKKFDKVLVETSNVADVLPPEVTLEGFGETEVKVDKDVITVRATAKAAKHPIASMRLLVDGRPFQGAAGIKKFADPQPTAEATWEVPLIPGSHTFAVIADTGVSRGMSKLGSAFRPGEPPKPNLYVLAMGVSDYPGDDKLDYCATDAQMLIGSFQKNSRTLFGKIEVKLLTDKQATKKGILEGLDWLKSKMTPQDVGVVSFSGHGTDDPLFGGFYLIPFDADPADMRTCLSGGAFKDRLDAMPGRLVAILDACRTGLTEAQVNRPSRGGGSLVRDLTAEDSGVIVMCASLGSEDALESRLCKAGLYSLALCEGMDGHGDVDGDGIVYLHELDLYATTRVRQLSKDRQNPTFSRPASVRPFPIAKPERPPEP